MSGAYYNEIDPYAAAWLRNLIAAGHIADGVVDERSIEDVLPSDLRGFTQCHFFAGIGVWSYALRSAGWADDRPVWTGSCPCQPFSDAGKGAGFADERHLWPAFFHLIGHHRPAVVIGEQVASSDAMPWLDLVQDDMEGVGYAFGAIPFPSAGVGAPHVRDRLYWMADAECTLRRRQAAPAGHRQSEGDRPADWAGRHRVLFGGVGDTNSQYAGRDTGAGDCAEGESRLRSGRDVPVAPGAACGTGPTNGFWRDPDWLFCSDAKWRPVEPGASPLAHGAPARLGRLRAYGNAINAEAARVFIESYLEGVTA